MTFASTLAAVWVASASGVPGSATIQPCVGAVSDRAPDPRCGEALDGRIPPGPSPDMAASRAALAVPRLAARAIFWPLVEGSDAVEHYRVVDWLHALLTTDDGRVGVRPIVHYSTTFLSSVGARFFFQRLPGVGSGITGQVETAGPGVVIGQLALHSPSRFGLVLWGTVNRRNDRLFAGIGSNSASTLAAEGRGIARFGSDNLDADLRWSRPLPWRLVAYAHGDLRHHDYTAADVRGGRSVSELYGLAPDACTSLGQSFPCVDEQALPGFDRGLRVAHMGVGLGLGLRDPGRERAGGSLIVDATVAQGIAGDPSRHATFLAETVLALGAYDHALLLRGRAAMVHRLSDAPVPFEELVSPAGLAGMRGFPEGRFRGQSGVVGTAEYRWYISSYVDASLFTDLGTVAGGGFSGIGTARWFPSYGTGLRFFKTQGPYWEAIAYNGVQLAYAPDDGFRFMFAMAGF